MSDFYQQYQQGNHQKVYDELLTLGEQVYEPAVYNDALSVMRAMMQRVHANIELLLPRLQALRFQFRKGGFWEGAPREKQAQLEREYPTFLPPTTETLEQVTTLEHLTGPLPLSLKCFYEEVGSVNLIGLFPSNERNYGCVLDPLCIYSVEVALQMVTSMKQGGFWEEEPLLILAGDQFHKYGYSGGGTYNVRLPSKAVDALLLDEPHQTTLVNYLRICMQWGGFPGFAQECRLSQDEFTYLTRDLVPF